MEYKLSFYNIRFSIKNAEFLYNSFSGALVNLDESTLVVLDEIENKNFSRSDIPIEIFDIFFSCGFIVDKDIDELSCYFKQTREIINGDTTLRLVIAPTLDCNFRCEYCYEEHNKFYMTEEVQDSIVDYLKERLETKKIKKLLVCWYGGEPLLAIDIITKLSDKFIQVCDDYKIKYNSIMVSNGYLLNDKNVKKLISCKVGNIQVTIDGTREKHGKRRILSSNYDVNTYDNILNGVNIAADKGINISIRINVDHSNIEKTFDAIKELSDNIINKKRIRIYLGKIFCMSDMDSNLENLVVDSEKFVSYSTGCAYLCKLLGFRVYEKDILPKKRFWFCPASYGNSLVIDPNGYLYYCWNDIGIEKYRIGKLSKYHNKFYVTESNKWIDTGKKLYSKCQQCQFLPLCGGGCLREYVHFGNAPVCNDKAKNIVIILKKYLERRS